MIDYTDSLYDPDGHIAVTQIAYMNSIDALEPTPAEFNAWLPTLESPVEREEARALGRLGNWAVTAPFLASFRQFISEHRRLLIEDYMAEHLSVQQFAEWVRFHGREDGGLLDQMTARIPK